MRIFLNEDKTDIILKALKNYRYFCFDLIESGLINKEKESKKDRDDYIHFYKDINQSCEIGLTSLGHQVDDIAPIFYINQSGVKITIDALKHYSKDILDIVKLVQSEEEPTEFDERANTFHKKTLQNKINAIRQIIGSINQQTEKFYQTNLEKKRWSDVPAPVDDYF